MDIKGYSADLMSACIADEVMSGRGHKVYLIIQHRWHFKQVPACMPHARHESAKLVRGQALLGFCFAPPPGYFKVIKLRRSDPVE